MLVLALPLVFPDGRSPSRTATRLVVTAVTAFTVASLVAPFPLENRMATVDNPIGLPKSWQVVADLLAIASLRCRLRRPAGRDPRDDRALADR